MNIMKSLIVPFLLVASSFMNISCSFNTAQNETKDSEDSLCCDSITTDKEDCSLQISDKQDSVKCTKCNGTGFITCPDCNGDGFIYSDPENLMGASWGYPCATCGGNAEDVGYDDSEDIQKGSGKIPCPECSKKGNK